MATIIDGTKLRLNGLVGDYPYEDSFSPTDVVIALAALDGQDIDVHVNSPGGIAAEGAAIHALLSARRGTTNIVVEGIAASAASLLAMAGDTVTMSAGAVMMIHDPSGMTWGTSAEHSKTIEGLEALANAYAQVYSAKSRKTVAECRAIMIAETWYDPQQAVDAGFADETLTGTLLPVAAFDYRIFAHAPERLVALAKAKNWQQATAGHNTPPKPRKEPAMSAKTVSVDAHLAATARIKAIMQAPDATGRDDLAQHLAFNTTLDAEEALAIMKAAPIASDEEPISDADRYVMRRLMGRTNPDEPNAAGLVMNYSRGNSDGSRSGLVQAMKKRHGVE